MATSTERVRAFRARQTAGLSPVDGPSPLDEDDQLAPAVESTIAALRLDGKDAAAAQLLRRYADVIDHAQDQASALRWIGPNLMKLLTELRATPMSRPAPGKRPERTTPNRVAQLRAEHMQSPAKLKRAIADGRSSR